MTFKYTLPENLIHKASKQLYEFANGGMQVTVKLKDGAIHPKVLISNSMWIVAMRGHKHLPFAVSEIEDIFQTEEDRSPHERGRWEYWDDWETKS